MAITPSLGARYFNSPPEINHGAPGFQYVYDSGALWLTTNGYLNTGGWRPIVPTDLGSTTNLSVSGLSLTVGAVAVTGIAQVALVGGPSNVVNSGGYVGITGTANVNVTNTAPLAISGVVLTIVTGNVGGSVTVSSVAVTGGTSGSALGNTDVTHTYLPVSGINFNTSVSVTSVGITGGVSGSALGNTDVTHTYLPVSGINFTAGTVTVGAVAITGFNSGSALANLDLSRTYLPISGVNTINVIPIGGFVGLTGAPVVTITGVLATSTSVTVGNVAVTGGNINVTDNLGWALLSGISGALSYGLSGAAWVTGQVVAIVTGNTPVSIVGTPNVILVGGYAGITGGVSGLALGNLDLTRTFLPISGVNTISTNANITNTAPLAISGVVLTVVTGSVSSSITNPIGVTGTKADLNGSYTGASVPTFSFLQIGGRAVAITGVGTLSGYNTGDNVMGAFNKDNGGFLVNQGVLDQTQDNVTSWAASTGTSPLSTGVSGLAGPTFFGVALPNNPARRAWYIVNLATGALMVKMSVQIPNSGNFDILLKPASGQYTADGGFWLDSPAIYTGPVSVSGLGGAPCVYRSWEL